MILTENLLPFLYENIPRKEKKMTTEEKGEKVLYTVLIQAMK